MKKVSLFFAFIFLFATQLLAQQSVKKLVQLGEEALIAHHYQPAIEYFTSAEEKAPSDANIKYQLAECYRYTFQYARAEKYYQQVNNLKGKNHPLTLFFLALTQKMNNKYVEAVKTFDEFIRFAQAAKFLGKDEMIAQATLEKNGCMLAIERSSLPFKSFELTHLPAPINTEFNDYAAFTFQHDSSIVITSSRTESTDKTDITFGEGFTDCLRFTKESGSWTAVQKDDDFDKSSVDFHEGSGSFNHDFSKYYFTRCDGPDCAIFFTRFQNGKWMPEVKLNDNINAKGSESKHPALSVSGDTLFFISNRAGGFGGNDVYMSVAKGGDQWGPPKNLGNKINTQWMEGSPFYFSKEKILIIASQGHAGYGGFDIFLIKNPFENPLVENIGKPFNSEVDELYFMAGSKKGYLSSNRQGGSGNFDIYSFDMRSEKAMIAAIEKTEEKKPEPAVITPVVQPPKVVIENTPIVISKEIAKPSSSISKFESIYFDFDQATLRPEAQKTLQYLASLYKKNENKLPIEINGFTDALGTDEYNYRLSLRRGMSASEYLAGQGIDRTLLIVSARGEGNPIASNDTPSGRQLNRRVEFNIRPSGFSPASATYIVEPKMTLYRLAKKYNTTVDEIKRLNGLQSNYLQAYRPLRVPGGPVSNNPASTASVTYSSDAKSYQIRKGDTIFSIVAAHNMTVERFKELNHLTNDFIKPGQAVLVEPRP